jgi:hypothetical protein
MEKNLLILVVVIILVVLGFVFIGLKDDVDNPVENNEPVYDFEEAGTIVYNNPGMEENMYFLIYDKEGAPGSSVKLILAVDSRCLIRADEDCRAISNVVEKRVEVKGNYIDAEDSSKGLKVAILTPLEEE